MYAQLNKFITIFATIETLTGVATPKEAEIKDNPYACLYRNYAVSIVIFIIRLKNYTNIYNSLAVLVAFNATGIFNVILKQFRHFISMQSEPKL